MKKKLNYISNNFLIIQKSKKAGLQIDFAFSILIFLTIFLTFYSMYSKIYFSQNAVFDSQDLDAISMDVCEVLVSTSGKPINWESDVANVNFTGLKSPFNSSLDSGKIAAYTSTNYWKIMESFNLETVNLKVDIYGQETGQKYLDFGPDVTNFSVDFSNFNCFADYNNEIVRVMVEVWK